MTNMERDLTVKACEVIRKSVDLLVAEITRLRAEAVAAATPTPPSVEDRSFKEMFETLTRCQARCTELLEEARILRRENLRLRRQLLDRPLEG